MRRLDFDKKGKQHGHNISHSKRHTKKVWKPNMQVKTLNVNGKKVKVKISANALRSLKKKGLISQLEK
jgi:large subunit ribosomal protein L28